MTGLRDMEETRKTILPGESTDLEEKTWEEGKRKIIWEGQRREKKEKRKGN